MKGYEGHKDDRKKPKWTLKEKRQRKKEKKMRSQTPSQTAFPDIEHQDVNL